MFSRVRQLFLSPNDRTNLIIFTIPALFLFYVIVFFAVRALDIPSLLTLFVFLLSYYSQYYGIGYLELGHCSG